MADLRFVTELDNAGVYERALLDPRTSKLNTRAYTTIDMCTESQLWLREVTPELVRALGTVR